jgi:Uma2 family endonuclease
MEAFALPTRRWTSQEYRQMVDAGIIRPDEHVQLLDGEIVTMTPQKGRHAMLVGIADDALRQLFGAGYFVRCQMPLALGDRSEPEPDLAVVAGSRRDYPDTHPESAVLVVEVADTSLAVDRQRKGPLYAQAGIPEYWLCNIVDNVLEVYREPQQGDDGAFYRLVQTLRPGESVTPLALPGKSLAIADLLP